MFQLFPLEISTANAATFISFNVAPQSVGFIYIITGVTPAVYLSLKAGLEGLLLIDPLKLLDTQIFVCKIPGLHFVSMVYFWTWCISLIWTATASFGFCWLERTQSRYRDWCSCTL